MPEIVKLIVNVPTESIEGLRDHARAGGITMTEALRRALGLQSFLDKAITKGSKVLIEARNGSLRQLILS